MVDFVGAGPGAPDLLTLRGVSLLQKADVVIYAGSLVNPELLSFTSPGCTLYNSATMTLEEVLDVIDQAEKAGKNTVRLHTGDPALYGAIQEQMDALRKKKIPFSVTPGVSSFCAAAAALPIEYTLPGVSQSVIISRLEGRTAVPARENLKSLAQHGASLVLFLSSGMLEEVQCQLLAGAYTSQTPAALVYKASWPEEKVIRCTVGTLAESGKAASIAKTALILVGDFLESDYQRSRLYDPTFTTAYREGNA